MMLYGRQVSRKLGMVAGLQHRAALTYRLSVHLSLKYPSVTWKSTGLDFIWLKVFEF